MNDNPDRVNSKADQQTKLDASVESFDDSFMRPMMTPMTPLENPISSMNPIKPLGSSINPINSFNLSR